MNFSQQECKDLREAIKAAQDELCVDFSGKTFPEGTAYYKRLEDLDNRFKERLGKVRWR